MIETELINECKRYSKEAQKELYLKYAPTLKVLCQRYAASRYSAADILQDGFIKIFSNIKQYKGQGSFEGWMRRIVINTAISFYRKKVKEPSFVELDQNGQIAVAQDEAEESNSVFEILQEKLSKEDVLDEISNLPDTLKLVLNLYIFESYSHKEISDELSISVQNSKVRLMRARQMLQLSLINLLKKKYPDCWAQISSSKVYNFQNAI